MLYKRWKLCSILGFFMKKYPFVSVLLASSILSNSVLGVIELDQVCDLSGPFAKRGAPDLSPIAGVDSSLIKGLRFNGHYGAQDSGFPAVVHNQLKPDDLPEEEVAAFLQRLFPSPVHDVLAANNLQHDDVRKWLTPQAIARLMVVIRDPGIFLSLSVQDQMIDLYKALLPLNYSQRLGAIKKNKSIKKDNDLPQSLKPLLWERIQKDRKVYAFVELMHQALATSASPVHTNATFYDPDIVKRALLTYMCLQVPGKLGLKPYYDTLAELGVIDAVDDSSLQTRMSIEAYESLKMDVVEGRIPFDEFLSNPEMVLQLRYGYDLFEHKLPPKADYITTTFIDPEGERRKFSNCGEATLLSFLAALMFNPNLHAFDSERVAALGIKGCSLKPDFANFLEQTLTSPAAVNSTTTQNKFVQIMSNMNTPETKDEIRYRKLAGKVVKNRVGSKANGIYEMDAGLDNFLRVVGALIGDPEWEIMQGTKEAVCGAVAENLTRLCNLFSSEVVSLDWSVKTTDDKAIQDVVKVDFDFTYNNEKWFGLSFGPGHFEFNRFENGENAEVTRVAKRVLESEKPWQPHFAQLIPSIKIILEHTFNSPELFESYIKGYLFASDMGSIKGRTKALSAILKYKQKTGSSIFDFLFQKWIKPKSEFFDEWNDRYTNYKVLNILAAHLSLEEIQALGIHQFNEYLKPERWSPTFCLACSEGRQHVGKLLLEQEGVLEAFAEKPLAIYWSSSDDDSESESDSEDSDSEGWDSEEENVGAENQRPNSSRQPDESLSILHSLARLDLPEYIDRAISLGQDLESLDSSGRTPLVTAVNYDSSSSVAKLLNLGANHDVVFFDGMRLLDFAISNALIDTTRVLLQYGLALSQPCKIAYGSNRDRMPVIKLLQENNVPFPMVSELLTHSSVRLSDFREYVFKYADDYRMNYSQMVSSLASSGQLEKLLVLKELEVQAGQSPISTFPEELSSRQKKDLCLTLISMNASLESLAPLCTNFDINDFREVLNQVPAHKKHLFKLHLTIKTKEDLDTANELQQQGIRFSNVSFMPSMGMGVSQRIELVEAMAAFNCQIDHNHLLQLSDQLFEEFMERCSPSALKGIETIIYQLAYAGEVGKLKVLNRKGYKPIANANYFGGVLCSKGKLAKVCIELLDMGGDLRLLNSCLANFDVKALQRILENVPLKKRAGISPSISIFDSSVLAKVRELKRLGCSLANVSVYVTLQGTVLTVPEWIELIQMGVVLTSGQLGNMPLEDFRAIVFAYPFERKTELSQLIPDLASNGKLAELRVLKEAGVAPDQPFGNSTPSTPVPMKVQAQVCEELLEMGGNLGCFSSLLNRLDDDEYQTVFSKIPKDRVSQITITKDTSIRSEEDLSILRSRKDAGNPVQRSSFTPFVGLTGEQLSRMFVEFNDLGLEIQGHNLDSHSVSAFANFIASYPEGRRQELDKFVPQIAANCELEHLRILKEAGVKFPENVGISCMNESVPMDIQAQVCLELLEMGGNIFGVGCFLDRLDVHHYLQVLQAIPKDEKDKLPIFFLTIRSEEDLEKLRALQLAGINVTNINFQTNEELTGPELARIYLGYKNHAVASSNINFGHISTDLFTSFVQSYPSERSQELAALIPQLTSNSELDKLRILRKAGVTLSKDEGFSRGQVLSHQFEVATELVRMGATVRQVFEILMDLEVSEMQQVLKFMKEKPEEELGFQIVESLADMEKLGVLVQEGNAKLGGFCIESGSEMSMEEKTQVFQLGIALGRKFNDVWHNIFEELDPDALEAVLREYPSERLEELKTEYVYVSDSRGLERVKSLVSGGVPFEKIFFGNREEIGESQLKETCLQLMSCGVDIKHLYDQLIEKLTLESAYEILLHASPEQKNKLDVVLADMWSVDANKIGKAATLIAAGVSPDYKRDTWSQSFRKRVNPEVWGQIEAKVQELKSQQSVAE